MTNPDRANALVRGHTHTWLYTSFIAPALLAMADVPGLARDFAARLAIQANLLHLLVAIASLAWVLSRRSVPLTFGTMAMVVGLPHMANITVSGEIDAFRLLPLVLAATMLAPDSRSPAAWRLAAILLGIAAAAHTLNIVFGPVMVAARMLSGLPRGQWRLFFKDFVPCLLAASLPVAAYHIHLWMETGRLLGNGLYYYFYLGPLASTPLAGLFTQPLPPFPSLLKELIHVHGVWPLAVPLGAILFAAGVRCMRPAIGFVSLFFLLSLLVMFSGCWSNLMQPLTRMMLHNFRYPIGILIFGPPLAAGVFAQCLRSWREAGVGSTCTRAIAGITAAAAILIGSRTVLQEWPIRYDVIQYLQEGEWEIARLVAQHVDSRGTWLTDRKTAAYYAPAPPVFLYSPLGSKWLLLASKEETRGALRAENVRLVAFYNLDSAWWPRTALHAVLCEPGTAERIRLPGWEVFLLLRTEPAGDEAKVVGK